MRFTGGGSFRGAGEIYNKNENMVAWRDGKLDAAAPDLISSLDLETGWAIRGGGGVIGSFPVGEEIAVLASGITRSGGRRKASRCWARAISGSTRDYVPIEKLHEKASR